jgi:hypothetical protein
MNNTIHKLILCTGLLCASGVYAGENPSWNFEFTPYLWYAGLEGDVTVAGRQVDFEKDASDLVDLVDIGGSFRIGAEVGRVMVGALVDVISLSTDELDDADQPQRGSMDSEMLLVEGGIGYRIDGWSKGQSFGLMAGVRHLELDNDLTVNGVGEFSRKDELTDIMFFLLPRVPMFASKMDGLYFNPVLGVGAGDSDLAYELFPQLQYQISEKFSARLGYRRVGWKLEDGDNELNVSLAGLIAGIGLKF